MAVKYFNEFLTEEGDTPKVDENGLADAASWLGMQCLDLATKLMSEFDALPASP